MPGVPRDVRLGSSDGSTGGGSTRRRVLLVDGHQDTLDLYRLALETAGFTVDTVTTGAAAWELLDAQLPDAVVTEIVLPGMDGFQLVMRMRGDDRTRRVPIVLLTTYPAKNLAQYAADMRIHTVLTKPCSPAELVQTLERAVESGVSIDSVRPGADASLRAGHNWSRHHRKHPGR